MQDRVAGTAVRIDPDAGQVRRCGELIVAIVERKMESAAGLLLAPERKESCGGFSILRDQVPFHMIRVYPLMAGDSGQRLHTRSPEEQRVAK